MDKKIVGLLGAVASVATLGGAAQATPVPTTDPMAAHSYADLLAPVPNALEALRADNLARASQPVEQPAGDVEVAQYYHHHHHRYYHHHHHHHHRVIIIRRHRYHHHHHHHHHHHGAFIGIPGVGGVVVHH